MRFAVGIKDNIVCWNFYYMGGRSKDHCKLYANTLSEVLHAAVIASVLGTGRKSPDWNRYELF